MKKIVYEVDKVLHKTKKSGTQVEFPDCNSEILVEKIINILCESVVEGYFQKSSIENQSSQRYNSDKLGA